MDLHKFDSALKSALENIEVPFDPSTWAALGNRLDALPAPDAVDKVLRPALERIETTYEADTWFALANRMESLTRVRRLRMTKLAEVAIFLLLLLNLKSFFTVVESVTNPVPVKKEVREPIATSRPSTAKKHHFGAAHADQNVATDANKSLADQVVAFVQNVAASLTQDVENNGVNAEANTPHAIANNSSVLDPAIFYSQSGTVKFPVGPLLPTRSLTPVLFASSMLSIPGIETPKLSRASCLYASSFSSLDVNYLREGEYSDKKTGYGGGFTVGYRKGKWGLEAGLQYSQKNYQPKIKNVAYQNDLNGVSLFNIENVDADVFSLPIKTTRRIAKLGKATAHAVAGLTANFATSKNYGYKTSHYPPAPLDPNQPSLPLMPLPNGKGALENGGLSHNAYTTADLGLRVEQPLGKRYTAFVEPVFRQSLGGGLGPSSARLSTFSLQAGVMASL